MKSTYRNRLYAAAALFFLTVLVFWNIRNNEFVSIDTPLYILDNPHVLAGLSIPGLKWAFTTTYAGFWHPLTWLSHMADCEIFGLWAGGHHLTSLFIHAASVLILFFVLFGLTGAFWPSFFTAGLFAWHPLRVETVAWAADRKDVLSGVFFMLTLWIYSFYARSKSLKTYGLLLLSFVLGLMAKPMLVTLPCVLLLLDYWPLGRYYEESEGGKNRFSLSKTRFLILEKIPLFALAFAASFLAYFAEHRFGAVMTLESFPLKVRIANALTSYWDYLGKFILPANLSVFYPYDETIAFWKVAASVVGLLGVTVLFCLRAKKSPYLIAGWLWYLVTLLPVIGIVQIGEHAMADRYTYIPMIGIFVILAWGIDEVVQHRPQLKKTLFFCAGLLLFSCMLLSRHQAAVWKDSLTLFEHAVKVTKRNYLAHDNLGIELMKAGKFEEAFSHFSRSLKIKPDNVQTHYNMGVAKILEGKPEEAIKHYNDALALKPDDVRSLNNLGLVLAQMQRIDEALALFSKAVAIKPDFPDTHFNLGVTLLQAGKLPEALTHLKKAVSLEPDFVKARYVLGIAYLNAGDMKSAAAQHEILKSLSPQWAAALFDKFPKEN